jgi:DNA-binding response OmpR family regulator
MEERRKTVLIVDDEIDLLDILKANLEDIGFTIKTATNGQLALDLISQEGLPDAILLDMKMPVMDGWTFARKFSDIYGRSVPIILMTGEEESRVRAMEIGADTYIGKPLVMSEIESCLNSILGE